MAESEDVFYLVQTLPPEVVDLIRCTCMPLLEKQTSSSPYVYTSSLVEVFSVHVDHFDSTERRGELYGTIEAVDDKGAIKLYEQDRLHSDSICANRPIRLTGPSRSIFIEMGFAVNLDLRLRLDGDSTQDVILCKWQFSWDATRPNVAFISRGKFLSDFTSCPDEFSPEISHMEISAGLDIPHSATFVERNGCCVTMKYAILQYAVQAWVQVEIVDVKRDVVIVDYDVRGSISASYESLSGDRELNSIEKDSCKICLFKTSELESVKVNRWKNIPLSRCIIAVPAHTNLIIEANLQDGPTIIAEGKVELMPFDHSVGVDYIKGDNNIAVRVLVHWYETSRLHGSPIY